MHHASGLGFNRGTERGMSVEYAEYEWRISKSPHRQLRGCELVVVEFLGYYVSNRSQERLEVSGLVHEVTTEASARYFI